MIKELMREKEIDKQDLKELLDENLTYKSCLKSTLTLKNKLESERMFTVIRHKIRSTNLENKLNDETEKLY